MDQPERRLDTGGRGGVPGGERLTLQQQAALEALLMGCKQTEAARQAGVHRNTVGRWLRGSEPFRTLYAAQHERMFQERLARVLAWHVGGGWRVEGGGKGAG